MKITAGEFIGMMSRQGIKCDVHKGQLRFTGVEGELLNKLRAVLRDNPQLAQGVKAHIECESRMTACEYLRECENLGVELHIGSLSNDIDMAGGNEKTRVRLSSILAKDPRLKSEVIRNIPIKEGCTIYAFMRRVIMECYGMGYDYAIQDSEGKSLKSWFTLEEVLESASVKGYSLTAVQAEKYLLYLMRKKYIEYREGKYRRCEFWTSRMEEELRGGIKGHA